MWCEEWDLLVTRRRLLFCFVWRFNSLRIGVVCHSLDGMWYVQLDCPEDANTQMEDSEVWQSILSSEEGGILEVLPRQRGLILYCHSPCSYVNSKEIV